MSADCKKHRDHFHRGCLNCEREADAAPSSLAPETCSADWEYHTSSGVNIWTWEAQRGLKYMVTQLADNIQAHITTGEAHKFTSTIGSYATVNEARQRCMDDWQNSD